MLNFFFFAAHLQGPDYRLYKSEPELTTVAEVDESNGEDRSEHPPDREHSGNKGKLVGQDQEIQCQFEITVQFSNEAIKLVSSIESCHGYYDIYVGLTLTFRTKTSCFSAFSG